MGKSHASQYANFGSLQKNGIVQTQKPFGVEKVALCRHNGSFFGKE